MSGSMFIPKLKTVATTIGQFIAILTALTPIFLWVLNAADARALLAFS